MKLTKKKVLAVALSLCLIAILSMGSLAWFSDTDSVSNKFLVTDSNQDGEADFSVDVKESNDGGVNWVDYLEFTDVVPGQTVPKWAVVQNTSNADSYSQYIRVTIEVVGAPEWKTDVLGVNLKESLGINEDVWNIDDDASYYDSTTKTNKIVMYLEKELIKGETVTIFEAVKIPSTFVNDATKEQNLTNFEIKVKAEAVQSKNIAGSAEAAFAVLEGN